jgi:hypothetical protein
VPLQNRVTPLGELLAVPARGLVYGNRGCLHDEHGRIRRRYQVRRWIACRLEFKGWHREPLMQPGKFTELFFLDEVTALAAGHRPCALCRRADYNRLTEIWAELHPGQRGADATDVQLHGERLGPRRRAPLAELPNGTFIVDAGEPWLVKGRDLLRWTPGGYTDRRRRKPNDRAEVITPPSLTALLERDWQPLVPLFHPSAL